MYKKLLTDPRQHNPEHYIYLAYGLLRGGSHEEIARDALRRIKNPQEHYRTSLVGKLSKDASRKILSWKGPINQTTVFGLSGLIVEPYFDEDIEIAWNCDLNSPWYPEFNNWVNQHKGKIKHPIELLTNTLGLPPQDYNEMALRGNPESKVVGVFYVNVHSRIRDKMQESAKQLAEKVSVLERTDIPVIEFPDPLANEKSVTDVNNLVTKINAALVEFLGKIN